MEPVDKFNFLDAHTVKEPFILDVLSEIDLQQSQALPSGTQPLATLDALKKSRNIKIPFSASRDKTIEYLLEMLVTHFPEHIKPIVTFDFRVEEGTKRLSVVESMEFTVNISAKDYETLCAARDVKSVENLMTLLRRFRFFNLTKLMKITRNKSDLERVLKIEEDSQIFMFRNYSLDKNKLEVTEDYCFHSQNYAAVRDSLNLASIQDILERYNELVARRLKNFGILNTYFSDYRDSKLDYILNILVNDLTTVLTGSDLIAAKNVQSLRTCILSVEEKLDPLQTLGKDILRCISENRSCTSTDLVGTVLNLTHEMLEKWSTPENLRENNIMTFVDEHGEVNYIDGSRFVESAVELGNRILREPEKMAAMSYSERHSSLQLMDILYNSAREVISSRDRIKDLDLTGEQVEALRRIVADYGAHLDRIRQKEEKIRKQVAMKPKASFIERLIDFIRGLFGRKKIKAVPAGERAAAMAPQISREIRAFHKQVSARKGPIHALSEFVDLSQENDALVDDLITSLREQNVKIVIPVYNAHEVLYPQRSQKVLIPEMEFLLVPPEVVRNPDAVRKYTDSLVGFKLKDEVLPSKAIILVEKYLLTQYRQKRAQMLKKEL